MGSNSLEKHWYFKPFLTEYVEQLQVMAKIKLKDLIVYWLSGLNSLLHIRPLLPAQVNQRATAFIHYNEEVTLQNLHFSVSNLYRTAETITTF